MKLHLLLLMGSLFVATAAAAESCHFDMTTLAFDGTPGQQALCLLRPVGKWGKLGPRLSQLPPTLASLLGNKPVISSDWLAQSGHVADLPVQATKGPVSRARDNAPSAPVARYFVIHDTSAPWLDAKPFPSDLDTNPGLMPPDRFLGPQAVAHAFIGRTGIIRFGHDFSAPWTATKREKIIGIASKGLFLHIENIQPRRRDPAGGPKNDAIAPVPGFSPAQYDRLAVLYIIASIRAGQWLIPAFHAALDEGIPDAHDDPQNFDLISFDNAISRNLNTGH